PRSRIDRPIRYGDGSVPKEVTETDGRPVILFSSYSRAYRPQHDSYRVCGERRSDQWSVGLWAHSRVHPLRQPPYMACGIAGVDEQSCTTCRSVAKTYQRISQHEKRYHIAKEYRTPH